MPADIGIQAEKTGIYVERGVVVKLSAAFEPGSGHSNHGIPGNVPVHTHKETELVAVPVTHHGSCARYAVVVGRGPDPNPGRPRLATGRRCRRARAIKFEGDGRSRQSLQQGQVAIVQPLLGWPRVPERGTNGRQN